MKIGEKIKQIRTRTGLTQEELANRSELSKGFISQVERDLTSPSIATLVDILECLGTNLKDFFNDTFEEKTVFQKEDVFIQENDLSTIRWLVPNSQKNHMEPILLTIVPNGATVTDTPHEGEEFGYILTGTVNIVLGASKYKAKKGESFYYKAGCNHHIENTGRTPAEILWVSSPPSF